MSNNNRTTGWQRSAAPVSILLALWATPSMAAGPGHTAVGSAIGPSMTITEGKSTLMRLAYPVKKMAVGDARIADVILLNKSEVYMVGKSPGSTNLILWNKNDDATIVDIAVQLDTSLLQARLGEVFPAEKDIRVRAAADSVILSGIVSDAATAEQVMSIATAYLQKPRSGNLASAGSVPSGASAAAASTLAPPGQAPTVPVVINLLTVAAPQQVMLEVKVAEISKTLVDQLGASFNGVRTNGNFTYGLVSNLLAGVPALGVCAAEI